MSQSHEREIEARVTCFPSIRPGRSNPPKKDRSDHELRVVGIPPGFNAQFGLKALVAPEWGLFVEGKYDLANISSLDPTFGLSGMYSIFHVVGGVAYHF